MIGPLCGEDERPTEDFPETLQNCAVACEIGSDEDCTGEQTLCAHGWHGGMNPEGPGFVRRGTNHGTLTLPGDDYGPAAELRIINSGNVLRLDHKGEHIPLH